MSLPTRAAYYDETECRAQERLARLLQETQHFCRRRTQLQLALSLPMAILSLLLIVIAAVLSFGVLAELGAGLVYSLWTTYRNWLEEPDARWHASANALSQGLPQARTAEALGSVLCCLGLLLRQRAQKAGTLAALLQEHVNRRLPLLPPDEARRLSPEARQVLWQRVRGRESRSGVSADTATVALLTLADTGDISRRTGTVQRLSLSDPDARVREAASELRRAWENGQP